jgi:hypothetical protein
MGRLRPHLNTIPLIVRSRGAKNPQIRVLFEVPTWLFLHIRKFADFLGRQAKLDEFTHA